MKPIFCAALLLLCPFALRAQIRSADLTASGLTCSMCSKAIYKSLSRVSFVRSIDVNLEASTYHIEFREDAAVSPDALRKAVADAGFAVASLQLNAEVAQLEVSPGTPVLVDGAYYRFLTDGRKTVNGPQVIRVVDKGFVPPQEARKYPAAASGKERVYNAVL